MCTGWFGGHKWIYPWRLHRICRACGLTQVKSESSQGMYWSTSPFDEWHKSMMSLVSWDKKRDPKPQFSEALKWVNDYVNTGLLGEIEE